MSIVPLWLVFPNLVTYDLLNEGDKEALLLPEAECALSIIATLLCLQLLFAY